MISTHQWLAAFLFALTIHALAFMPFFSLSDAAAKAKGEMGIEIDLGMMGDLGTSVAPPAEDMEEQEESTAPPEPKEVVEPVEEDVIKEVVEEPIKEIIKPLQALEKTPEVKEAKVKIQQQAKPKPVQEKKVEEESVEKEIIKEKVSPQPNSATSAPKSASPKQITTGRSDALSTGGSVAAKQSYFSIIAARLTKHKRYPSQARRRNQEGVVTLFFIVNRDGKVLESRISRSSGYKKLDDAVLRMLRKAAPFPSFSDDMEQAQLSINIPIEFKLKKTH
ncbi:MAG: energy transducer TonB [Piscirickettsiaceae bacterium]|nr:energy transducer TonB [Piscirickettsiaceae bacterium]